LFRLPDFGQPLARLWTAALVPTMVGLKAMELFLRRRV
jgi:hypothetical protein